MAINPRIAEPIRRLDRFPILLHISYCWLVSAENLITFIIRVEGYKTFSKHASESFHSKTQKLYLKLKTGKNQYRSLL